MTNPKLKAGDIIFVRGRTWRKRFMCWLLHTKWNHVMVVGDRQIYEATFKGLKIRQKMSSIFRVNAVVLRPKNLITKTFLFGIKYTNCHWSFKFDYLTYIFKVFGIHRQTPDNRMTCDAYVDRVYDFYGMNLKTRELLNTNLTINTIRQLESGSFQKIYDYRW